MMPASRLRRGRPPCAAALVAALVLCTPSSVLAAGLRRERHTAEAPRRTTTMRTLLQQGDRGREVRIRPFTAHLLAVDFPFQPRFQGNALSGAVSKHVAAYLSAALDRPPLDLGLSCHEFQERMPFETRWAVECEGAASFEDAPSPSERTVNEAVHGAFSGTAEAQFLAEMYPQYETLREKSAWDAARDARRRPSQGRRSKKEEDKKKKKKKKKPQGRPNSKPKQRPNKQAPTKRPPKPGKKPQKKEKNPKKPQKKPHKQRPSKPPSRRSGKRPASPGRPAKNPPSRPQKPQMQQQLELAPGGPAEPTGRDGDWLDSHNDRRKTWHTKNGEKYAPLKWSRALQAEALVWAQHLAAAGAFYHDPKAGTYGENLAKNGGQDQPATENVLSRWVEDEAALNYPANGHLTQVLWRATKYVGCADARSGNTHVQACRYARPGNCNMAKYSTWLEPMLEDTSPCGATCHPLDC